MNNRILFSHSYFMRFDPKQWNYKQPFAPLGTIQAAAYMRQNGYEVALFDTMFTEKPEEIIPHLDKHQPAFLVIYDDGFNYLTKMCLTNMREAAWKMSGIAKQRGITVIVSSSDSTDHYEKYLSNGADYVILGEGEQTLLELVELIRNGQTDVSTVKGITYKRESETIRTGGRPVMKDLDALPLPAWDLVDVKPYKEAWLGRWGYFSINIATTRGCPYKCNWCAKPIYGNAYNMRSPEHVVRELKMLKENFNYDHVWFCDDIFGLKRNWVIEFAELVKKEGLKFKYKIQSRADLLVQEKYVEALAESGCENVWMGAESGSQKILDAMDKGTTIEQIKEANRLLKQYGIRPAFFLQFGYLGETVEDIQKTINLLNECLPDDIGVSVSYPLPGTKFYETVKSELVDKTNWTDSDELALMFKNTYSPAFYKQLHRYIHKNYRKHQAYESIGKLAKQPLKANYSNLRRAASVLYYIPATIIEKRKLNAIEDAGAGIV
jgi:anaerobic magnesium-protoporphyrin IX monomethyl ester cyclase